jgi:pimeloyl-ACP methyl ester carboxylesterase
MAQSSERRVKLWQDTVETVVEVRGGGPAVVYLHGPWGLRADGAFLDLLSQRHTVYAPRHPGTVPEAPDAVHELDTWLDLLVYYGELFDLLGLAAPVVVGHSFGGMVAAEIAAATPERVERLILIDPIGLWRDDLPVQSWMILPPQKLRRALFAEPDGEAAQRFFSLPEDHDARAEVQANFIWTQACTGKFVWPIPDKGLKKHIHRIATPTLLVWGAQDGIVVPAYAQEFAGRISGARVELIGGAGHLPYLEQPARVAQLVWDFASSST